MLRPLANTTDAEKSTWRSNGLHLQAPGVLSLSSVAIDEIIVMGAQVDSELLKVSCRPPRGHWQRLSPNGTTPKAGWDGVKTSR